MKPPNAEPTAARVAPIVPWRIFDVNMRLALVALICGSVALAAEAVPDDRSAVFPREHAADFVKAVCLSVPDGITGFWSPALTDLRGVEASLSPFLRRRRPELLAWLNGVYEGASRWTWLRRQAVGIRQGEQRLLLVSYACEYPPETLQKEKERKARVERMGLRYDANAWKTEPLFINDGGMSYFRALFDPAKREFIWYEENFSP
jgi:hypothetical protein